MRVRTLLSTAAVATCLAASPASQPASSGDLVSIGDDLVRFVAPPPTNWTVRQAANATADVVYFVHTPKADAEMQFMLAKADFRMSPDTVGQFAAGIVKSLRDKRQKDGTHVVMPATIEHDRRLDIVIHEKFTVGAVTEDQMHLYKSVGPRTLMLTVSTVSPDPASAADTFAAAKTSLASAKYNRKPAAHK
jgi:hypothetical protein